MRKSSVCSSLTERHLKENISLVCIVVTAVYVFRDHYLTTKTNEKASDLFSWKDRHLERKFCRYTSLSLHRVSWPLLVMAEQNDKRFVEAVLDSVCGILQHHRSSSEQSYMKTAATLPQLSTTWHSSPLTSSTSQRHHLAQWT